MVTFSIRFCGRFVLARQRSRGSETGHITFLAPGLESPPEIGPHIPVMSVSRNAVVSDHTLTTVPPSWRAIAAARPQEAEHLMWDLRGTSIVVPSKGGLKLKTSAMLPDLGELEKNRRRPGRFDVRHLKPSALVGSTIELAGGEGEAKAAFPNRAEFIPEHQARSATLAAGQTIPEFSGHALADWVDVHLPVESATDASGEERGTLALHLQGKTNGMVVIDAGTSGAAVSFSNLCSTCPRTARRYDLEFGQYYRLLEQTGSDRLIPMVEHLGEQDCDGMAQVWYDSE